MIRNPGGGNAESYQELIANVEFPAVSGDATLHILKNTFAATPTALVLLTPGIFTLTLTGSGIGVDPTKAYIPPLGAPAVDFAAPIAFYGVGIPISADVIRYEMWIIDTGSWFQVDPLTGSNLWTLNIRLYP